MNIAKIISIVGIIATGGAILYGLTQGNFAKEGKIITSLPWGIVSLVDLYTGFTLFSGWIIYREKSAIRSIGWIIFLMTFGFFAGAIYALQALMYSKGNWQQFWMGHRYVAR